MNSFVLDTMGSQEDLVLRAASPTHLPSAARSYGGRFGAAAHDPLHPDRWYGAYGNPINQDLASHLQTISARCQHEYMTSPFFRGVVRTYAMHVTGSNGPTMQIVSDYNEFNETIERDWRQVFRRPDPAVGMTGADYLRVTVNHLMNGGSSLDVLKKRKVDPRRESSFGWQTLPFSRLMTPPGLAGDPHVFMGIHFNRDGSRKGYYFAEQEGVVGGSGAVNLNPRLVPADLVQHIFLREEGEQATGAPWMASAVNTSASLAEYDADVMESSKNAARMTTFMQESFDAGMTTVCPQEINRGGVNVLPSGVVVSHAPSTQPLSQYQTFRHEKLVELGRGVHMPLILVLLSAQGSNFSSAQYDGTLYADGIGETQTLLEQQSLRWKVEQLIVDRILQGKVKGRPDHYEIVFNWPKPPHANIEKIVKALSTLYHDQAISLFEMCSYLGWDYETIAGNLQKENELKESKGLRMSPIGINEEDSQQENTADSQQESIEELEELVAATGSQGGDA